MVNMIQIYTITKVKEMTYSATNGKVKVRVLEPLEEDEN